jgi:hypothetical protein
VILIVDIPLKYFTFCLFGYEAELLAVWKEHKFHLILNKA